MNGKVGLPERILKRMLIRLCLIGACTGCLFFSFSVEVAFARGARPNDPNWGLLGALTERVREFFWKLLMNGVRAIPLVKNLPPITSLYGSPRPGGRVHAGVDLGVPLGTGILTPITGQIYRFSSNGPCGDGAEIRNRWFTFRLCHAKGINVANGSWVTAGSVVAHTNATGSMSGPHIHIEMYDCRRAPSKNNQCSAIVDPKSFFENRANVWGLIDTNQKLAREIGLDSRVASSQTLDAVMDALENQKYGIGGTEIATPRSLWTELVKTEEKYKDSENWAKLNEKQRQIEGIILSAQEQRLTVISQSQSYSHFPEFDELERTTERIGHHLRQQDPYWGSKQILMVNIF